MLALALAALAVGAPPPPPPSWDALTKELAEYRADLAAVRRDHGGARKLPVIDFYLFGMGGRSKYLYRDGALTDLASGKVVHRFEVAEELIAPSRYAVALKLKDGTTATIYETESALILDAGGTREVLAESPVSLPEFAGHPHSAVLRVLHQELLVNVVGGKPVPNLLVYARPWYRDGAMVAMCLARTGNLPAVRDWILSLREPFDRNNKGESEADNPGQVLYLVSLVADAKHPAVAPALAALKTFEKGTHVEGRSDFALHPVYQTKWAKFGLRSLGLPDPYTVPAVPDTYAQLFWWDTADVVPNQKLAESADYPYLTWAGSHALGAKRGLLGDRDYPLTWEAKASQADYAKLAVIDPEYARLKLSAPHTWHAAEAFLMLLGDSKP